MDVRPCDDATHADAHPHYPPVLVRRDRDGHRELFKPGALGVGSGVASADRFQMVGVGELCCRGSRIGGVSLVVPVVGRSWYQKDVCRRNHLMLKSYERMIQAILRFPTARHIRLHSGARIRFSCAASHSAPFYLRSEVTPRMLETTFLLECSTSLPILPCVEVLWHRTEVDSDFLRRARVAPLLRCLFISVSGIIPSSLTIEISSDEATMVIIRIIG